MWRHPDTEDWDGGVNRDSVEQRAVMMRVAASGRT
jgi:hypothetical protein